MSRTATKSSRKGSAKDKSYIDLMQHAGTAREFAIGRDGAKVQLKNYHLDNDEIKTLRDKYKADGIFPNPFNRGCYHYIVQSLVELGMNEQHPKSRVIQKMKTLMSDESTKNSEGVTAWERFEGKDPRVDSGLDVDGRIDQNITVLQRDVQAKTSFSPYGFKLLQVCQRVLGTKGGVIDVLVADTGTEYVRLNTESKVPLNENRKRGMTSPTAQRSERKAAKVARKARKPKVEAPAVETEVAVTA